jgi:hypothetical protein
MRQHTMVLLAAAVLPSLAAAQSPVAEAFRKNAMDVGKNLIAAAETMPAEKYGFKPTPAQMSFADIVDHLSQGNDYLCGVVSGMKAAPRAKVGVADGKDVQVKRLKETFESCNEMLTHLDDSSLSEQIPMFGTKTYSRAMAEVITTGDWADHYSQMAIYLRLNGLLPPTAKK